MKNKSIWIYFGIAILIISLILGSYFGFKQNFGFKGGGTVKIFWVNSYHSIDFPLTQNNILEFRKVFENNDVDVEIKQFDMNTIIDPSEENKISKALEAINLIEEWGPDLLYITDDPASEYVGKKYLNSDIPIVFSGVNEDPKKYGYNEARNVAGVLERVHFVEAVNLLNDISPGIEKIGVLGSDFFMWGLFMDQMKEEVKEFSNIEFVGWDMFGVYEDFQDKVLEYQDNVDAIVFLGVDTIVDRNESVVSRRDFIEWMVNNNELPEATFWNFYPLDGILLSVDVSAHEQGKAAGLIAYKILFKNRDPSSFEFKPTVGGEQYINLARAKQLDFEIPSSILVNSKIYETFPWEEENEK